jgi:hypothetical protein
MRKTTTNTEIYFSIPQQDEKNYNKDINLLLNTRTRREKVTTKTKIYFSIREQDEKKLPYFKSKYQILPDVSVSFLLR